LLVCSSAPPNKYINKEKKQRKKKPEEMAIIRVRPLPSGTRQKKIPKSK
jgi:hypothetical protein